MRRWGPLIKAAARTYRVNPALIAAIITRESGGYARAWNRQTDARGLMQVLHGPWDPRANIKRGTGLFAAYHQLFHSLTLALAAYDAGPNMVELYNGVPPFVETQLYVPAVTALFLRYRCARG
jgi:soluble lytic murein transglycosylase-like protein